LIHGVIKENSKLN